MNDRRLRRVALRVMAVAILALVGFIGLRPFVAAADPVVAPKDSGGKVSFEVVQAGDGTLSGTLTLVNPNNRPVTVALAGAGRIANCRFGPDPEHLPALSSTEVTFKTSGRCDLDKNGEAATLTTTGASKTDVPVSITLKDVAKPVSLGAPLVAFLDVAPATALFFLVIWWRRPRGDDQKQLGWSQDLAGLPTDWTFKDSWATNVGTISTLFVAIFGTNDVVTALVGEENKTLPGRLLIIAAIAGLILGLAPLAVKAIGPLSTTATVSGLMVGAWLTTTAIAGQVVAVYAAFAVDKPTGAAFKDFYRAFDHGSGALVVAVILLLFLAVYVERTLSALLVPGSDPPPKPTDEMLVASAALVAAEVCCDSGSQPDPKDTTLLATAYVRAVTFLEEKKKTETDAARTKKETPRTKRLPGADRAEGEQAADESIAPEPPPAAPAPEIEPQTEQEVERKPAPKPRVSEVHDALDDILRRSATSQRRSAIL